MPAGQDARAIRPPSSRSRPMVQIGGPGPISDRHGNDVRIPRHVGQPCCHVHRATRSGHGPCHELRHRMCTALHLPPPRRADLPSRCSLTAWIARRTAQVDGFKMRWTQVGDLRSFTKGRAALLTAVRCNYLPGLPAWRVGEPILVRERDLSSVTSRRAGIASEGGVGSFLISDLTVHDRGGRPGLPVRKQQLAPQRTQQKGTLE